MSSSHYGVMSWMTHLLIAMLVEKHLKAQWMQREHKHHDDLNPPEEHQRIDLALASNWLFGMVFGKCGMVLGSCEMALGEI
mgnify:CR=1 FL=1